MYDWRRGARKLHECRLETHASDLDRVIEYLQHRGARKVFAVGHSYGGPTILMSKKKQYDAVVLWDASYGRSITFLHARPMRELNAYYEIWGYGIVMGKKMVEFGKKMTPTKSDALIKTVRVPIKITVASRGDLVRGGRRYFKAANPPKAFAIIKGADHNFSFEGNEEALFRETLAWLRKWK